MNSLIFAILEHTFLAGGFTTRSDFARNNAEIVAQLAQQGLLTTDTPRDGFGSVWRLSGNGFVTLSVLSALEDTLGDGNA